MAIREDLGACDNWFLSLVAERPPKVAVGFDPRSTILRIGPEVPARLPPTLGPGMVLRKSMVLQSFEWLTQTAMGIAGPFRGGFFKV